MKRITINITDRQYAWMKKQQGMIMSVQIRYAIDRYIAAYTPIPTQSKSKEIDNG